ncbi:hypothetical protein NE237_018201 [Protea cynaroides]|uniref:Uncharacterized protein n=1 Tax=Protea cynaroides TaxID=273540 RepID=A0A9Q0K9J2_9MAGN|nr:hypothetical protein NE237_018201 [Protea cynaroides]
MEATPTKSVLSDTNQRSYPANLHMSFRRKSNNYLWNLLIGGLLVSSKLVETVISSDCSRRWMSIADMKNKKAKARWGGAGELQRRGRRGQEWGQSYTNSVCLFRILACEALETAFSSGQDWQNLASKADKEPAPTPYE